jgi:hypothetical protein
VGYFQSKRRYFIHLLFISKSDAMTMTKQSLSQRKKRIAPSRSNGFQALPDSYYPSKHAVICAKGKKAKEHPGNQFLNSLIRSRLEEYSASMSKLDRSHIVSQIMNEVKDLGGLFVRQLTVTGPWFDVGPRNSREKIGQVFRDALHELFRSSTKAKAMIRRKRDAANTVVDEDKTILTGAQGSNIGTSATEPTKPDVPHSMNRKMGQWATIPSTPVVTVVAMPSVLSVTTVSYLPTTMASSTASPVGMFSIVDSVPEASRLDIEPLPLNHALIEVDFDTMSSASSEDSCSSQSFEDAMDEMYKHHFLTAPFYGYKHCFYSSV